MRLEWKGYRVTTTDKEQELLTNIARQSFDLLIIDLLALTPHAVSLLERLKRKSKFLPPIVVIDDEKSGGYMNNELQIECIDYVIKKPLIQSFFDQINLSVFKVYDTLQNTKSQSCREKKFTDHLKKKSPRPYTSNSDKGANQINLCKSYVAKLG